MHILFLTIGRLDDISVSGIYTDLLRKFYEEGHNVYAVGMHERKEGLPTTLRVDKGIHILQVKTLNIRECGFIEKGLSTILIGHQYKMAIRRYFRREKFDLVLYSTPPITLLSTIKYLKRNNNCITYLMLKDIFPQNIVDMGLLNKKGIKGILYKYFRYIEKEFYKVSDYIGCMSNANIEYLLAHNPEVNRNKVEICPNAIEIVDQSIDEDTRTQVRIKYNIPLNKKIFIYGGNLGLAQDIDFLITCIESQSKNNEVFFVVVGNGTEYGKLDKFVKSKGQENFMLLNTLPKEDYDILVASSDIGMLFLNHKFTVPNFPSRLLGYLQAKIPVLACTDNSTDVGKICVDNGFGWWCESNSIEGFTECIGKAMESNLIEFGRRAYEYYCNNFDVHYVYQNIIEKNKRKSS